MKMMVISNQSRLFENYFENRGRHLHETDPVSLTTILFRDAYLHRCRVCRGSLAMSAFLVHLVTSLTECRRFFFLRDQNFLFVSSSRKNLIHCLKYHLSRSIKFFLFNYWLTIFLNSA